MTLRYEEVGEQCQLFIKQGGYNRSSSLGARPILRSVVCSRFFNGSNPLDGSILPQSVSTSGESALGSAGRSCDATVTKCQSKES